MKSILEANASMARQVLLITDGDVSNGKQIVDMVQKKRRNTRVFALGIELESSNSLMNDVAKAGRGIAENVPSGGRIETAVASLMSKMFVPVIQSVDVEWHGGAVTKYQSKPPAIYR